MPRPTEDVLRRLFGRTRAEVLRTLSEGFGTTGDIAGRLGISMASASEHACLLRAAGLVASERSDNTVWHRLTPLGFHLLFRPTWQFSLRRPAGDGRSTCAIRCHISVMNE